MAIEAIYPKKKHNLSDPDSLHKKYPYLLRNFTISRPNQVWGTDITYLKLSQGFAYLTAIMDWFSRYVVAWEIRDRLCPYEPRERAADQHSGYPQLRPGQPFYHQ